MTFHFPNLDTLRLALTSGAVPSSVSLAPVRAARPDANGVTVEPSVSMPKAAQAQLRRLGVQVLKGTEGTALEDLSSWPQIVPLERTDATAGITSQTPVLFELRPATLLAEVVGEMLRLGNDR